MGTSRQVCVRGRSAVSRTSRETPRFGLPRTQHLLSDDNLHRGEGSEMDTHGQVWRVPSTHHPKLFEFLSLGADLR